MRADALVCEHLSEMRRTLILFKHASETDRRGGAFEAFFRDAHAG